MKKEDKTDNLFSLTSREMFGIPLFGSSRDRLLSIVEKWKDRRPIWIATVNPEFVMNTLKDQGFLQLLKTRTTVNVIDGVGLAWGVEVVEKSGSNLLKRMWVGLVEGIKVLGGSYKDKVITGVELTDEVCRLAAKKGEVVFFYGGWGDRAKRTAEYFTKKHPSLKTKYKAEDFDFNEKYDYLLVARGMKKQELWIEENLAKIKCKMVVGLGRTFDYYSGDLPRAPQWMRRVGLEWFYSLVTDKERRWRKLELLRFLKLVLTKAA